MMVPTHLDYIQDPPKSRSIQSFVDFQINRFDKCGVEQDLNLNKDKGFIVSRSL